jgi:Tol biopolymer transport system component
MIRRFGAVGFTAAIMLMALMGGSGHAAFHGQNGRIAMTFGEESGQTGIITVRPDGTDARVLTTPASMHATGAAWSPNGRRLAFTMYPADRDGPGQIWIMRADGSGKRMVIAPSRGGSQPAWSPNGRRILYRCYTADYREAICSVHPDGRDPHKLFALAGHNLEDPSFSPSGTFIVFDIDVTRLAIIHSNGTHFRSIPNTARLQASEPSWSPNGRWIAFSDHTLNGLPSVFLIHPDGSGLRRITYPGKPGYRDTFPVWSPDATKIAFQRGPCYNQRNFSCDPPYIATWVIGVNRHYPHTITHDPKVFFTHPDWGGRPGAETAPKV